MILLLGVVEIVRENIVYVGGASYDITKQFLEVWLLRDIGSAAGKTGFETLQRLMDDMF